MKIQLIRSATIRFTISGHRFIFDPYLSPKFALPSYTGASLNPIIDLPFPAEEVISGIEMAVISHLHSDHFDPEAKKLLPKNIPVFCQPIDAERIHNSGFSDIHPVGETVQWKNITITRTPGQHGTGSVLEQMGEVSGFVFQSEGEPTVYSAGDTILSKDVKEVLKKFNPDIIITHSSGAVWGDKVKIIMDETDTIALCRLAPQSRIIAVHMDSLDHGTVTRRSLREYAEKNFITEEQLLIPEDGEILNF